MTFYKIVGIMKCPRSGVLRRRVAHRPSKNNARNRYSWWSKRRTLGNFVEYEGRFARWVEGKSLDSVKDNEVEVDVAVEVIEGREKSQGCDGTGDVVAQVLQRVRICGRDRC